MPRRWIRVLVLAGMATLAAPAPGANVANDELSASSAEALRFVQGLNERGYTDLALDYVEQLRQAADTPADLRAILDYEEAISRLEDAVRTPDLVRRAGQYDEARRKLEAFLKGHPKHPVVLDALKQQARLLVEAAHIAALQAQEAKFPGEVQDKQTEARTLYGKAREAYARAEEPLKAVYDNMPKSLSDDDPLRAERDKALLAWIDARLQRALVDYDEAQTYPPGDSTRDAILDRARALFTDIANHHRTQMAGVVARMWQGKCFEERGELGKAIGIYDELMAEPDPRLKPLQRQVDYFRIILMGRRHDYALAVDEAASWLKASPKDRHSDEGLGVLVEYARGLLAQAQAPGADAQRDAGRETARKAREALTEVVHFNSRHRPAAYKLLRQVRSKAAPKGDAGEKEPTAAAAPPPPASMKVDDALNQAEQAMGAEEFAQALPLLRHALRRVDPTKDADREKANRARAMLAYALYETKRYDEADIVAEHLARNYPKDEFAPKAIEIALASLVGSYSEVGEGGSRAGEIDRLASLSEFATKALPESESADIARLTLGDIEMNRHHYLQAAQALEALRESSPKRADALAKAGSAHWYQSQELKDKPQDAKTEVGKAIELLQKAIKLRQDAKAPPTDTGLVTNACDLAEIQLYQDRPADALALLEPLAKAVADKKPSPEEAPLRSRLISTELRALIGTKQVDKAIGEMKALEAAGGAGQSMAQLYFTLGRLLEREIETLKAQGNKEKLKGTQETYEKFLDALVANEKGQTYESLEWAGESMLKLGSPAKAAVIFERVAKVFASDPQWMAEPDAKPKLNRARMMLIRAEIEAKDFDKAQKELDPFMQPKQKPIDIMMEQGRLHQARSEATGSAWSEAANYWRNLAMTIGRSAKGSKMPEYYETWYNAAFCLAKQGKTTEAIQSLRAIMIQSRTVGSPEMKQKYDDLIRQLSK